jgi:hypothetical protein
MANEQRPNFNLAYAMHDPGDTDVLITALCFSGIRRHRDGEGYVSPVSPVDAVAAPSLDPGSLLSDIAAA